MSTTPDDPEDRMTACIPEGVCPACGISKEWSNSLCSQPWHPSREVPSAENGYGGYCMCDGTVVCGDHERLASPVQGNCWDTGTDDLLRAIQRCPGCGISVRVLYEGHTCDGPQPFDPAPSSADWDAATERVRAYLTARTEWAALTRLPENDEIGARFGDDATPVVVLLASDLRALLDGSERLGRAIREALAALESSKGHDSTMNARSQQAMGILHAALDASIAEQEGT